MSALLGLLTPEHAQRLKACGVDKVNHNLNTSERFYPEICTTHTYQDRLDTLRAVPGRHGALQRRHPRHGRDRRGRGSDGAGAARIGRGIDSAEFFESDRRHAAGRISRFEAAHCLKALAMMRLVNPRSELRIAGGREMHLGSLQALGLYAANSIFVGDYLTTKGQLPAADYRMIEELGFIVSPRRVARLLVFLCTPFI